MIWQLHLVHAPSHVKGQVLSLANVQRLLQATQQTSCCCDALSRKSIVVKKLPRSQAKRVKGYVNRNHQTGTAVLWQSYRQQAVDTVRHCCGIPRCGPQ